MQLRPLRYPAKCGTCGQSIAAKSTAWRNEETKVITCLSCMPDNSAGDAGRSSSEAPHSQGSGSSPKSGAQPVPPPVGPIDRGTPGFGAKREYERRVAKQQKQIEEKWGTGKLGRFVKFVSDEPQSTKAWSRGAAGEEALGGRLNDDLGERGVVLHDRKIPGSKANIDHIVIGPTASGSSMPSPTKVRSNCVTKVAGSVRTFGCS